jgi:hypothetical protein
VRFPVEIANSNGKSSGKNDSAEFSGKQHFEPRQGRVCCQIKCQTSTALCSMLEFHGIIPEFYARIWHNAMEIRLF